MNNLSRKHPGDLPVLSRLYKNALGCLLCFVGLLIFTQSVHAQTINITESGGGGNCLAGGVADVVTLSGSGGSPIRNIYTGTNQNGGSAIRVIWTGVRWEIQSDFDAANGVPWTALYFSPVASAPNPPTSVGNFGNWQPTPLGCNALVAETGFVGSGTQDVLVLPPVITAGTATGTITACQGTASVSPRVQSFTVSGATLTNNIVASAPANFEISTVAASGYATSLTLTQSGGTVSTTTIFVRSSASAPSGPISGNVTLTSTGATSRTVAVAGTINAVPAVSVMPASQTITAGQSASLTASGATTYSWSTGAPTPGITVSPTLTTNYTVTGTTAGCSATAVGTVVVIDPPTSLTLVATANPTVILNTGTITLSANVSGGTTPYSYTFAGLGAISASGNTATVSNLPVGVQTFTVTAADAGTPAQTISATVSVTVNQANRAPVAVVNTNQTATVGTAFSYTVNAFTDPDGDALTYTANIDPANGLSFNPATRVISGTPSMTGVSNVTITATDPGSLSASTTFTVSASAVVPTPPATLTITSFACFSTAGALSSVNFVVGYSDGTFTPALPPLFIVGVTANGQLGVPYTFGGFDGNVSTLPIADNASRTTYFVWDFRAACGAPVTPPVATPPVAPVLPNQTATQGTPFSYTVPPFTGTTPIAYSATGLPAGLSFDANSRIISGTPSMTGVSTVVISATNSAGQGSGQFTITVNAPATPPTGPATLTITSFTCFSTAGALSSVNFVVGYSDGTFTPAVPPLFIVGVTANGQLGQPYSFGGFDGNTSTLPIADNASRVPYFVWDFRAACAAPVTPPPTGPATLTITSFTCFSTAGALSSVNFVVGYSDGTFTPALPPLFIVGVTANGQLGQPYTFGGFDGNVSTLPIADNASRVPYFVWNFRAACATPGARIGAESTQPWQAEVQGNPVQNEVTIQIAGAKGQALQLELTTVTGRVITNRSTVPTSAQHREVIDVSRQSGGLLILRITDMHRVQTVKVIKQ